MFSRMSLKGIRPRLIVSTTLLLLLSLSFVASVIYFLFSHSLRKSDQNLLLNLRETYTQLFLEGGPQLLQNRISPEILVVILEKPTNKIVFEKLPSWIDHDFEDEEEIEQLKEATEKLKMKEGWTNILLLSGEENNDLYQSFEYQLRLLALKKNWQTVLPIIDNDLIEVYSAPINERYWMFIGRSSEVREESLSTIRYISLFVIFPFILIGFILSYFLARNILKPIKELATTMNLIKNGNAESRAKVRGTDDEIDLLTSEFNSLLDRNRILIRNLRETVDNVAHDLRTPLTRFRSNAEHALLNSSDTSELRVALQDAVENSDNILELLNGIMVVAEAESQIMQLNLQEVSVKELLDSVTELYEHVAEQSGIKLEMNCAAEIRINCDPRRIIQALGNLLDNAIKFSPAGGTIRIRCEADEKDVTISIVDHGRGISADELPRIWSRLYRGDGSRTTPGLGIGLSLVKAIINSHHGTTHVTSEPGKGSCFSISLPRCNGAVIRE
jgi:signal transduction histidine kinase